MIAVKNCTCMLVLAVLLQAKPAAAQNPVPLDEWQTRGWIGEVTFLGVNSILASLAAGITQELRNGSFQDGFAKGALGGAVAYGGRRLAVENFDGAGFIARQLGATGASMARNAGEGRSSFERLYFPVGPVTITVERKETTALNARVNLIRPVANDSISVDGEGHAPGGVSNGIRTYTITRVQTPESLVVTLPRLGDQPESTSLTLDVVRFVSGDTIVTARGQAVAIGVSGRDSADSLLYSYRTMQVRSPDGRQQVSIRGSTPVPSVLRFPPDMIPDGFVNGFVDVQAESHHRVTKPSNPFTITLSRTSRASIPLRETP